MGQVPKFAGSRIGIVGDGRVSRHFQYYLYLKGIQFQVWHRRMKVPLEEALEDTSLIVVLISDRAIVPWLESNQSFLSERTCVHFSGSLVTDLALGFHPLQTFGGYPYSLEEYERIYFVGERGRGEFSKVFPELSNPWGAVPREEKTYYHALCAMACNTSQALWIRLAQEFKERWDLGPEAWAPFLRGMTENLVFDPEKAQTGPASRGDRQAVEAHLSALKDDPYSKIYQAFTEARS